MKKDPLHYLDTDDKGRAVILVPLGEHQGMAKVDPEDWRRLLDAGYRGSWFLDNNGTGAFYVKMKHQGRNKRVARLIAGEPPNRVIRYRNRDHQDLRRENLVTASRIEMQEENRSKKKGTANVR